MANSLIDFSVVRPEAAGSFLSGFQQSQDRQQALAQQQRQNALLDLQLRGAQRGEEEALTEREAYKGAGNLADVQQRLMQAGLGKQSLALQKQQQEQQTARIKQAKDALDLTKSSASQIMQNPDPAFAKQKILSLQALTGQDMTDEIAVIDSFGGDPVKIKNWAAGHALEADKLLPKFETRDVGGAVQRLGYDPLTGAPVGAAQITQKTMTPYEMQHLKVQQGQLAVAQQRLAKEGANLDPAEQAAVSKAIIEGRVDPNRVNGRNAKIIANTLLTQPDANLTELGVTAAGAMSGGRALGTQSAKMLTAANEADQMIDVVRTTSAAIDRTKYPTINAIQNAIDKGTGGKEIVQLNASINALVNSYARAISPTGQPTVSDKNHARDVINSAYSKGQIEAITDIMRTEMNIAKASPGESAKQLREQRTGKSAPAASGGNWKDL